MCHAGHIRFLKVSAALRANRRDLSEEGKRSEWESVEAVKIASEAPIIGFLQNVFEAQSRLVLERLPDVVGPLVRQTKRDPLLIEGLLSSEFWDELFDEELTALLRAVIETGFRTGLLRVQASPTVFRASIRTEDVLAETLRKTKGTTFTTQRELAEIVFRGLQEDLTIDEISARIRRQFRDWQEWRAPVIAQTASTSAFEVGQSEGFVEAGIDHHMWLSQRDGRVRPSHFRQDGDEVEIGQAFPNGLTFPGDPTGPAREVVGCRCTVLPVDPDMETVQKGFSLSQFNDRERQRIELALRDYRIRTAYPPLRDDVGQLEAFAILAEKYHVSESTVKAAVYGR